MSEDEDAWSKAPQHTRDMATVLYFLKGAKDAGLMFQGHTGDDAFRSACRLLYIDHAKAVLLMEGFVRKGGT